MTLTTPRNDPRHLSLLLYAALLVAPLSIALPNASDITLDSPVAAAADSVPDKSSAVHGPENFHRFSSAYVGEVAPAEAVSLHFAKATTLTKIELSKDFRIERGGTCAEGRKFLAGQSCVLMVSFTPKHPGNRLGKLTVSHSASATPVTFGFGGSGTGPIVSFIPALITTVPGSYPSSVGLLSGARNLTVDGSDTLYIADPGSLQLYYMDSGGTITPLTYCFFCGPPNGVAVDSNGNVFFHDNFFLYEYDYTGSVNQLNGGSYYDPCEYPVACNLVNEQINQPGGISIDAYDNLVITDNGPNSGADILNTISPSNSFYRLLNPFSYASGTASALAVDAADNIYTSLAISSMCSIEMQNLYNAENYLPIYSKVVGGRNCGYGGDGGRAGNARIGSFVGQISFDLAGNLYFSDTYNQRVRRVDFNTGIIRTIAGNGTTGYTGDGGGAVGAELSSPTGVSVDSQGQVYIISSAASGQVVRKVGPFGVLQFGSVAHGTTSAAHQVVVTNTGNSELVLSNTFFTGVHAAEFSIDPTTTSCNLSNGAVLNVGQTCKLGILFKPATAGPRVAGFTLVDNSSSNFDVVLLRGTGT